MVGKKAYNNALQVTPGPLRVPAAPERRRWAAM